MDKRENWGIENKECVRITGYTDEELNYIYDKNDGYYWHCGKKLAWKNYSKPSRRGAWEVDHSRPLSRGGTDYLRNLVPACIECNRSKSDLTSQEFERCV